MRMKVNCSLIIDIASFRPRPDKITQVMASNTGTDGFATNLAKAKAYYDEKQYPKASAIFKQVWLSRTQCSTTCHHHVLASFPSLNLIDT